MKLFILAVSATLIGGCLVNNEVYAQSSAATATRAALDKCFDGASAMARAKKVSPDTFRLVINGACSTEVTAAREALSAELDAATPAGLSFDPGPTKARYIRSFDQNIEEKKAKLVSEYALSG